MTETPDLASPKTQRRMWRRVWFCLAFFILVTPVTLWFAIDHAGRNEWQRAQVKLNSKGEAAIFEDLGFPEKVSDERNFCALPFLTAQEDGNESAAMTEFATALKILKGSLLEPHLLGRARGRPLLGIPRDFEALARSLDLAAEENGVAVDPALVGAAGRDPIARIHVHLNSLDRYWQAAEEARNRSQAVWLPMLSERLDQDNGRPYLKSFSAYSLTRDMAKALAIRAAAALQVQDYETALRSLEIAARMMEAYINETRLSGGLAAMTICIIHLDVVAECLWHEGFQNDPEALLRLQKILETWDMIEILGRSIRGELVFGNELMLWTADHRADGLDFVSMTYYDQHGVSQFARYAPEGWFHNNAAYGSSLLDETLLEGIRSGEYSNILKARDRLETRLGAQSLPEQLMHVFAISERSYYERFVERGAYLEALRRQALIVCARHRYRIDHSGKFPLRLSELVPDYLEKVPSDPIDGIALHYVASNDGTFLIYSVGFDGNDDDGIMNFHPGDPMKTQPERGDYIGDWPWPVEPLELPANTE